MAKNNTAAVNDLVTQIKGNQKGAEAATNDSKLQSKKSPQKDTEAVTVAQEKSKTVVFGFRASEDNVNRWKTYAAAAEMKVSDFGTAAVEEYVNRHPLTADQKRRYNETSKQAMKDL